jgi:hypothetical protein
MGTNEETHAMALYNFLRDLLDKQIALACYDDLCTQIAIPIARASGYLDNEIAIALIERYE